jgi:hypothetical protein
LYQSIYEKRPRIRWTKRPTINASAVSAAPETVTTVPAEGLTWLTCDRVQQESAGLRSDADEQDQR